ncbi:GNAT family N-acetyltransferase [Pontibacter silvestris]|uniref:GNAT family N-acetyltransferase n=1 Tax=Pontibacter silvestris TaxID=2305183 RepID=A0ABW4WW56_9BACT|nr:GNAT family N-acetyltransferase [Pontibacter silvestris]MCC9136554.1 GNAT family N-acetyltransferase [Pontibacter silvestris]
MIKYLTHDQLDKQQWDALIERSLQQQVYALSWYLDVVSPGWEAVVEVGEAGEYKVVMPLPVRYKLGVKYLQQPLFCQQLGAFSLEGDIDVVTYKKLIGKVYEQVRYVNELQFNTSNVVPDLSSLPNVEVELKATHYLDLSIGYDKIFQNYSRDRKRNLKRARKNDLEIIESDDIKFLISFFKDEVAGRIYGGVAASAYTMLEKLHQVLREHQACRLYYIKGTDGKINAGRLILFYKNKVTLLVSASSAYGRKLNGRTLVLDQLIQEFAGRDYIIDFESPDKHEQSLIYFYESFGPKQVAFQAVSYNRLPKVIKLIRNVRMRIVRMLRGLANSYVS